MFTRRNVHTLGTTWAPEVLWYARGVAALRARAVAEPTSWRFYAGIHGFQKDLWQFLGYWAATDTKPAAAPVRQFWDQCQHQSWYFLPWHRGYLLAFEATVRQAIADLHGPSDTWALPYWNYLDPGQDVLPAEFASETWPDGAHGNPLYVEARYGPDGDGHVFVPAGEVNQHALDRRHFTGVGSGGSPGFGGVDTGFSHSGNVNGALEDQPHNMVHGLVGGAEHNDPNQPGVMSDPRSAALDPIFWLHHANIDRLWEVWRRTDVAHTDPTAASWLGGPASVGDRAFCMPMPDGTTWTYTPNDVVSISALGYKYEELPAPPPAAPAPSPDEFAIGDELMPVEPGREQPTVELLGATEASVPLRTQPTSAELHLDATTRRSVADAVTAPAVDEVAGVDAAPTTPERVFLNLENVRGTHDATTFQVYVGLHPGEPPADHPELLAGSIAPFGVSQATDPDGPSGGEGLTYVLDVSALVARLHRADAFDLDELPVTLVPLRAGDREPDLRVGRISMFRQRG